MATPEDMRANAEYIRMADQVVDVPGGSNNNNYANVNLICEIAERLKVDAVMPMWGHASENPTLPNSLKKLKHRVTFIGPPAEPMQALGDKIGSTIIAQSAGVPTIGWNGDSLTVNYKETGIPQDVYDLANVKTAEDALACANRIGYPVMIKASEGGGGKGIRKVLRPEDVMNLFRQVQAEIPGSPIFVMKMASRARHLEVQLLADQHGDAIALSGRDCSVQRRHQKIIEEGPPIAAPVDIFKKMEQAAVSLAKTVGYCNAGTVEYLYLEEDQSFAFLELNPRLQVEHPVTENILGINLPSCQLQVAMGIPLSRIGDIRRLYGRHPRGRDTIDFDYAERQVVPRHCIAVRITAENPEVGFQPSSGKIRELQFRSSIDCWGYFSVDNSGQIHEFADSQFGHIFASGRNRESARHAMIVALKELQIRGDIHTTVEYIIKMLQAEDFIHNRINTDWLDGRIANHKQLSVVESQLYRPKPTLIALCGVTLRAFHQFQQRDNDFIQLLRVGQVPTKGSLSSNVKVDLIYNNVKYKTTCVQSGPEKLIITCNGVSQHITIRPLSDGGYLMNIEGCNHLIYAQEESGGSLRMILDGHTCIFTPEYDPTRFISSMAGKIARLLVEDHAHVNAGDAFIEIEVMKMYMPLRAQESGKVHFMKSEGATLSPGDIIAKFVLDNPDKVVRAEEFEGVLVDNAQDEEEEKKKADVVSEDVQDIFASNLPHVRMKESVAQLEKILDGFPLAEKDVVHAFQSLVDCQQHPLLPVYQIEEIMSILRGRIDADLFVKIQEINHQYKEQVLSTMSNASNGHHQHLHYAKYPAGRILQLLHQQTQVLPADKKTAYLNQINALWLSVEAFLYSHEEVLLSKLMVYIEQYLTVEKLFDDMSFTDVVNQLRKDYGSDLPQVLYVCRSHENIRTKNILLLQILSFIKTMPVINNPLKRPDLPVGVALKMELPTRKLKSKLTDLSKLRQIVYGHVSFEANLLLVDQFHLSIEVRRQKLNDCIIAALNTGDSIGYGDRVEELKKLMDSNMVIRDLIIESLRQDTDYQLAVMELYIRRIYQKSHELLGFQSGASLIDSHGGSAVEEDRNAWISFEFVTRSVEAFADDHSLSMTDKNLSFTDLANIVHGNNSSSKLNKSPTQKKASSAIEFRYGILATIESIQDLPKFFSHILAKFPNEEKPFPTNAIHIIVRSGQHHKTDEEVSTSLSNFLASQMKGLLAKYIRRVTFFVGHNDDGFSMHQVQTHALNQVTSAANSSIPSIFTFRHRSGFAEDKLFRHVEAPHAFHLDLPRLSNFSINLEEGIQTSSGNVHLYRAYPKVGKGPRRFFVRIVSFSAEAQHSDVETLFVEALDHLGLALGQEEALAKSHQQKKTNAANHFFINVVSPDSVLQPDLYETLLRKVCTKYWYKMVRLAVSTVELKLTARLSMDAEPLFLRLVATNPTGFVLKVDKYYEMKMKDRTIFKSLSKNSTQRGVWDGQDTQTPYETTQRFEIQRAEALASSDTLYVYDWPILFESATEKLWESSGQSDDQPEEIFVCQELVLCDATTSQPFLGNDWTAKQAEEHGILLPTRREAGKNNVGMVAWLMKLTTPEYPQGRELVVICNDITFLAGSFGTKEDIMFFKASEYARLRGIPRIYLAANSGARIGMAQSLKSKFQICWNDEHDPAKGFKYIYLSKDDYDKLMTSHKNDEKALPVNVTPLEVNGITRYVIDDIIGEESDLGVENLMGSGLIAGETARAYNDIFTLTMVVGRSVGIGAYLVRLGQRTIQKTRHAPIILTGYQALNKLMGRDIYTTNDQLGGPMIMFPNGVSHLLAETHFDAVLKGLEWLSFVPSVRGSSIPSRRLESSESINRLIQFAPQKGVTYDPRLLLCGIKTSRDESSWKSGFFDKNSFVETLSGWAKTVVVGRARLGGIPMGVIVTENRTAETLKPADPADITSQEKLVQQAGGVWFPDSAYKTAQALRDFNREGLPCMIFANWRGFSGGQRDMFDEVLKFGSMIVDALVAYQQPLFVYIPPFAELRGGAWVVVDSTINAEVMEFYAAEDARGGVLEATGAASIKFRDREILECAHRIDPVLIQLDYQLKEAQSNSTPGNHEELDKQIKQREKALFGVYQQVSLHFIFFFSLSMLCAHFPL